MNSKFRAEELHMLDMERDATCSTRQCGLGLTEEQCNGICV